MYELRVKTHFDAAHFLKDYPGRCANLHGHRWDVELVIEGSELYEQNMLLDFTIVKGLLGTAMNIVDHQCLNEVLKTDWPTAEYVAKWLYEYTSPRNKRVWDRAKVVSVTVWESPDCCARYYEET